MIFIPKFSQWTLVESKTSINKQSISYLYFLASQDSNDSKKLCIWRVPLRYESESVFEQSAALDLQQIWEGADLMREEWQLILSEFSVDAAQNGAVSSLPIEAQLEAERKRIVTTGIAGLFHVDENTFIITDGSRLCQLDVMETGKHAVRPLITEPDQVPCLNVQLNGSYLSWVHHRTIECRHLQDTCGDTTVLASPSPAHPHASCGSVEFVMAEEFSRYSGYWWQPCPSSSKVNNTQEKSSSSLIGGTARRMLYTHVDESMVPIVRIADDEEQRYPRAGDPNACTRLFLLEFEHLDALNRKILGEGWAVDPLKEQFPWYEYLVRAGWVPGMDTVWLLLMDRPQQRMSIVCIEIGEFGKKNPVIYTLLERKCGPESWINPPLLEFKLSSNGESHFQLIIQEALNDDQIHYVRYRFQKYKQLDRRQLTRCTPDKLWSVCSSSKFWIHLDRYFLFHGRADSQMELHLYYVDLHDPQSLCHRLTAMGLSHSVEWFHDPVDASPPCLILNSGNLVYPPMLDMYTLVQVGHELRLNRVQRLWGGPRDYRLDLHLPPSQTLPSLIHTWTHPIHLPSALSPLQPTATNQSTSISTSPRPTLLPWHCTLRINDEPIPLPHLYAFTNRAGTPTYAALFLPTQSLEDSLLAALTSDPALCPASSDQPSASRPDQPSSSSSFSSSSSLSPSSSPYPLLLHIYGGPQSHFIGNHPHLLLRLSRIAWLVSLGYAVLVVDNRGTAERGMVFEQAIRGQVGSVELVDWLDGLTVLGRWLDPTVVTNSKEGIQMEDSSLIPNNKDKSEEKHLTGDKHETWSGVSLDFNRVALFGWSYGGYLALRGLALYPHLIRTVIAGAPVTDWRLYDSVYTERYLGLHHPHTQSIYDQSSLFSLVPSFPSEPGRLLILHGERDDNVHRQHTQHLQQLLTQHGKSHHVHIYAGERHGLRQWESMVHFEHLMTQWLLCHLSS